MGGYEGPIAGLKKKKHNSCRESTPCSPSLYRLNYSSSPFMLEMMDILKEAVRYRLATVSDGSASLGFDRI
jgi:hypothetical protein